MGDCRMSDEEVCIPGWVVMTAPDFKSNIIGDLVLADLYAERDSTLQAESRLGGGHGQHNLVYLGKIDRLIERRKNEIQGAKTSVVYNPMNRRFEVSSNAPNPDMEIYNETIKESRIARIVLDIVRQNTRFGEHPRSAGVYIYYMARQLMLLATPMISFREREYVIEKLRELDIERNARNVICPSSVVEMNEMWAKLPNNKKWTTCPIATFARRELEIAACVLRMEFNIEY